MKKFLVAIIALLVSSASMAQDYKYLTVATSSMESSIELASIQKITFDVDNKLVVVVTSEGEVSFPQAEMQKMYFTDAATAVGQLPVVSDNLKVAGGLLKANGKGLLRIYNASGALQRMANVDGEANINLNNLPAGVYIVNLGKQSIKVVRN